MGLTNRLVKRQKTKEVKPSQPASLPQVDKPATRNPDNRQLSTAGVRSTATEPQ